MRVIVGVALLLMPQGCASETPAPRQHEPWDGTVETAGETTVVHTRAGAVWVAPATLQQELVIGVEAGAQEYMLGSISALAEGAASIYIADYSVPVVREYDREGRFIRDLGREGEGPGEYRQPGPIAPGPDGLVAIRDDRLRRLLVFDAAGEVAAGLRMNRGHMGFDPIVFTDGGRIFTRGRLESGDVGVLGYGLDGSVTERSLPELDFEPMELIGPGPPCVRLPVPYAPRYLWTILPDGSVAAASGESDEIWIDHRSGGRTLIRRELDRVPMSRREQDYWTRYYTAFHLAACGMNWTWNGPSIPEAKAVFRDIRATASGEIWAIRHLSSERLPDADCDISPELDGSRPGRPCWADRYAIDVFGPDGRYRGELILPDEIDPRSLSRASVWIDGPILLARVDDEAGTVLVRRYRRHVR